MSHRLLRLHANARRNQARLANAINGCDAVSSEPVESKDINPFVYLEPTISAAGDDALI